MNLEDFEIKKGGTISVESIFAFDNPLDVTLLIDKCRRTGCTLRFENEDLTIDDSFDNDPYLRTRTNLYSLLACHPKAAQDYFNYLFKKANQEAPGK